MIRDMKYADIPAVVALLADGYSKTNYPKLGVKMDIGETKRLLMQSIQRHGHKGIGACWVQVAENDGSIDGLILGTLVRVYSIGDMLQATDLFWYTNDDAMIGDAMALMRGLIEWAWRSPHVAEVRCGTTAIILSDPSMAGRILQRLGLKHYGHIYRADRPAMLAQEAAE